MHRSARRRKHQHIERSVAAHDRASHEAHQDAVTRRTFGAGGSDGILFELGIVVGGR